MLDFLKKKPGKIVCVGLNYKDHADELGMKYPDEPILFMKPVSSLIGSGDSIVYPSMPKRVDYEAELAIVIKDRCKDVAPDKVMAHILGFTCLNDVTARDLQQKDGQWTRAKSFDTFCPVGPKVVMVSDPNNLKIEALLNDEVVQSSNTSNFIFSFEKLVSFISKVMTLDAGDIITTGTPSGIGPMQKGDKIEIRIEGIGSLVNFVK